MTKLKRARTLVAIMLISVCVWVAVVGLVIKPPFWLGAILSIIGGSVIGLGIFYLMMRWWFKGIEVRRRWWRVIDVIRSQYRNITGGLLK